MKLSQSEAEAMFEYISKNAKTQSAWEIATNTGYGVSTIQKYAVRLGVTLKPGERIYPKRQQIKERIDFIMANGSEMTIKELAFHFKVTYNCIHNLVDTYNLPYKEDYPGRSHPHSRLKTKKRKDEFYNEKIMAY